MIMGSRFLALSLVAIAAGGLVGTRAESPRAAHSQTAAARVQAEQTQAIDSLSALERERMAWPEDRKIFLDAAKEAWAFVDGNFQPATGFISPIPGYAYATVWDIGSMIGALYSAHGLGLIDDARYAARLDAILSTLMRVRLSDNRVFNKTYDARTGAMPASDAGRPGLAGGWSATDLGRLLIWLKIVGTGGAFDRKAEAVVRRIDFDAVVKAGYLWGANRESGGRLHRYLEGHIGYEQYAARGFALWGHRAEKALSLKENALPISVMGQPLIADFRRWDRLTSEPFLLWGLELGWDPQTAALARRLLLAQAARSAKTGVLTMTGEDALPDPPHYFYYYCVYADGQNFAVEVQDRSAVIDGPRWISAKSAFGFHALMPTRYTGAAVEALKVARGPNGWASGVYEGTGRSTGGVNLNTAAVILAAALVDERGAALLPQAARP